jgi:diguanylate cyclase (GGDEF)-like protein
VQILIVEDDAPTRLLLEQILLARGHSVVACESAERAAEAYRESFFPLVVLDLYLPGMDGFEFCRWLRAERDGDRPYVLIGTASREPADLRRILEAGADDYLFKPYQSDLLEVRLVVAEEALRARAARKQLTEELQAERDQLAFLAAHDSLTKLYNRDHFTGAVENAVVEAEAGGPDGALFYLDLDHFKIVNDALGHAAGDRLLVQIAYLLRNAVRPRDLAARFGGDKFVVLQPGLPLAEARLTAERVRTQISNLPFCDSGRRFQLGASIGVAAINGETLASHVLAAADSACFSAKVRGRDRVEVYCEADPELARLRDETARLADLRQAVRGHGFTLRYQPVVDLETSRVVFHDARTFLCAADGDCRELDSYLVAAGRSHLVPEIDRCSIRLAARALASRPELRLTLGLAVRSLADVGLPAFAQRAFEAAGVPTGHLTFEVTEAALLSDPEMGVLTLSHLRAAGFHLGLEGLGSGGGPFNYLRRCSFDYLKVREGLVCSVADNPLNLAFVKVLSDCARHLEIRSIASGVQNGGVVKAVHGLGIDLAQGRYFGDWHEEPQW